MDRIFWHAGLLLAAAGSLALAIIHAKAGDGDVIVTVTDDPVTTQPVDDWKTVRPTGEWTTVKPTGDWQTVKGEEG